MLNCPAAHCSSLYACRCYRHFGCLKSLLIQLTLTISFLPFSCSNFNANITWAAYEYQILVCAHTVHHFLSHHREWQVSTLHTDWGFSSQNVAYGQTDRCSQQKVYNLRAPLGPICCCARVLPLGSPHLTPEEALPHTPASPPLSIPSFHT